MRRGLTPSDLGDLFEQPLTDRYHDIAAAICRPYIEAFAPGADVAAYMSDEPGMIGEPEAEVTTCWDYADEEMMSPGVP